MDVNLCYGCMLQKESSGPCPRCGFDESVYTPAPHHLPPGTVLYGKYLIGRVLGEGGFGITYVGWDLNLEMKVAIKEYYPNGLVMRNCSIDRTVTVLTGQKTAFFQQGLEKFVDEARRLGKFWRLPGIVAVKDYFQENKTGYIVMEFAEGQTLRDLLKTAPEGRLPAQQVFEMMRPVMKSLEKVHKAGLIHRDISPDNLMVNPSEDGELTVKLIDFGAARDYMAEGERSLSVMLKPGYAPEEQYRSRGNQGPWTDVYGLCATMYRAITGQVPEESLDRMAEDLLKPPSALGIPISEQKEAALMQGLALFQQDRFGSMEALETALYDVREPEDEKPEDEKTEDEKTAVTDDASEETAAKTPAAEPIPADDVRGEAEPPQPSDGHRPKRMGKGAIAAAAAAGIILLAAVIWGLSSGSDTGETRISQQETEHVSESRPETERASESRPETESEAMTAGETEHPEETETETSTETEMKVTEGEAVVWSDAAMERLVRQALDRPEGDIYAEELAQIRVLRICKGDIVMSVDEDPGRLTGGPDIDEPITSLEDLRYFPNLTILQVSVQEITDISILEDFTSLTELNLWINNISDISVLSNLTSLTVLDLSMNDLDDSDITVLSGLTSLEWLCLSYNELSDLSPLSGLTSLKGLALYANNISDLRPLESLTRLETLDIGANNVSDISALANLTALENLALNANNVSDIQALSGLTALTQLQFSYNKVSDISPLSGLTRLNRLRFEDNQVSDLTPLSNLSDLGYLYISRNPVEDTSCLDGIEGLTIRNE